jgi:Secretion system C-terminal sorting domain
MNRICLGIFFFTVNANAQPATVKQWDYRYGGVYGEVLNTFCITADSGFMLAGFSDSDSSGDVSQHTQGNTDFWVVKTDAGGLKQWDKRFGGFDSDRLNAMQQTADGGYIFGGYTESDSTGDMSQPTQGNADYWIVKTDANGIKQWDKRFGGAYNDFMTALLQTPDGGYLLAGTTFSDSTGNVSHYNNGGSDYWIVKTDAAGNKLWDKIFGGYDDETLSSIAMTPDGGFALAGSSLSDSTGDVSQHTRGGMDYWVVKTDSVGTILWDKRFGGSLNDFGMYTLVTYDGGLLTGGFVFSDSTGDVSQHILGASDYWLVKTNANGVKQWNKRYGGDLDEHVFCNISKTLDGKYLISGLSYSYMSGDKSEDNMGPEQPWYLKIDTNGTRLWDKTIFTTGHEEAGFTLQTADSCYVTALYTPADIGGYKSQPTQGFYDYWFVKLCDSVFVNIQHPTSSLRPPILIYPNPVNDVLTVQGDWLQHKYISFCIYDLAGKIIYTKQQEAGGKMQEERINVANIANGIYLLEVKMEDKVERVKFVKE